MLSERFRLIVNRLRVENRSPSGKPESLFLVIPDMCDRESIGEGFWIESILVPLKVKRYLIRPLPILNFRHIVTVLRNVRFMIDLFIADRLLGIGRKISQLRHTIDHIRHKMKPVQIV